MQERIERMAQKTWDVIGGDALNGLEEQGKRPVMKREHVVQMVMDYMDVYGGDKEAYETWKALDGYEAKEAALMPAFPYETYGW